MHYFDESSFMNHFVNWINLKNLYFKLRNSVLLGTSIFQKMSSRKIWWKYNVQFGYMYLSFILTQSHGHLKCIYHYCENDRRPFWSEIPAIFDTKYRSLSKVNFWVIRAWNNSNMHQSCRNINYGKSHLSRVSRFKVNIIIP